MQQLKILVVDDEGPVLDVLNEYLVHGGHSVVAVASGQDALHQIEAEAAAFDVAIVDWYLPGITGRDVIDSFRDRFPRSPVMVSTGEIGLLVTNADPHDEVIFKPYSLRELLARVLAMVDRSAAAHSKT